MLAIRQEMFQCRIGNHKQKMYACNITTLVTSTPSPKHLGLGVHLYHEFNSRHLIEDMSALGYTITYPDLRMFLTSAAHQAITAQKVTPSGGIVPDNITSKQRGVADNWDHNERTGDGKRTTHAMTSILVSSTSVENRISQRLGKSSRRPFDKKCLPGEPEIESFCQAIATHVVRLLDEFREEGQKVSPTFQVWNNYLSRVSTPLKLLLASTRSPKLDSISTCKITAYASTVRFQSYNLCYVYVNSNSDYEQATDESRRGISCRSFHENGNTKIQRWL
ncbi:hypothetical protein MAR_019362 [Mya arenaria]|uniref:Uncharacterized protein n=1 Tax=Mya arenaria TaxID=6604 RepID=A0ABY7EJS6_MYAAR|nr:hypothetical protein MAR_019362 [Mya arenaria]